MAVSGWERASDAAGGRLEVMVEMRAWSSWRCWQRVKFLSWATVAGPVTWRASGPVDICSHYVAASDD